MSNQRHSPEFKDEAVRQILQGGHSTTEVAARLGVSANSLYSGSKPFSRKPICSRTKS